jgi:hypothetical protein
MESSEAAVTKIFHDLANLLNTISSTVQLQEWYLANDAEHLHELLSETTKNLKNELARLQIFIEELRQALKVNK